MASRLEPAWYPLAASYLDALPRGLASYPECTIKADFHVHAVRDYPDLFTHLPDDIAAVLREPRQEHTWMPFVPYMVTQMIMVDRMLGGDVQVFRARVQKQSSELFANPLYRALVHLMSPTLLLMGADRRFNTFCRGLEFGNLSFTKVSHEARMAFPPHLVCQIVLDFFAATFEAALRATRVRQAEVVGAMVSPTEARFHGRWS